MDSEAANTLNIVYFFCIGIPLILLLIGLFTAVAIIAVKRDLERTEQRSKNKDRKSGDQ